jgi:hypothetical protein
MLEERLREQFAMDDAEVSIARRSPLGPFALRIVLGNTEQWSDRSGTRARAADLGRRLAGLPWIESVAVQPPRVFATLADEPLRTHVITSMQGSPRGACDGQARGALVGLGGASYDDLMRARITRTANALLGILRYGGYDAAMADPGDPAATDGSRRLVVTPAESMGNTIEARHWGPAWEVVEVGAVDVPRGPMLAQWGGVLFENDVVQELLQRRPGPLEHVLASHMPSGHREAYARALLTFMLLRTARCEHVGFTEERLLVGATEAFGAVLRAKTHGKPSQFDRHHDALDPEERRILMHAALLPSVVTAADRALDPSLLVRFIVELADHALSRGPKRPSDHPVPMTVSSVIDEVLRMLDIIPLQWAVAG